MTTLDLSPETKTSSTIMPMILWGVACLIIAGAITSGFLLTGGPHHQRLIRLDNSRESDLQYIEGSIAEYYEQEKRLPASLSQLKNLTYHNPDNLVDPSTKQPYRYSKLGADRFKLCANFGTSSAEQDEHSRDYDYNPNFSRHAQGKTCFIRQRNNDTEKNSAYPAFRSVPE